MRHPDLSHAQRPAAGTDPCTAHGLPGPAAPLTLPGPTR